MRAHHLLEHLLAGEMIGADEDNLTGGRLASILEKAVTFDFGEVELDPALIEFGAELRERGLFRLPFETVFYSARVPKDPCWVEDGEIPGRYTRDVLMLANTNATGACEYFYFSSGLLHPQENRYHSWLHDRTWFNQDDPKTLFTDHDTQEPKSSRSVREDDPVPMIAVRAVEGLTALLMSDSAVRHVEPASAKLNRRRAEKGKPPINDTIKVTLRAPRYVGGGTSQDTHASPRLHWRRGHFRTLKHEKYGTERVVPVAPCLVGAADGVMLPPTKTYQVESSLECVHEKVNKNILT
jgi:hypothetical protein